MLMFIGALFIAGGCCMLPGGILGGMLGAGVDDWGMGWPWWW